MVTISNQTDYHTPNVPFGGWSKSKNGVFCNKIYVEKKSDSRVKSQSNYPCLNYSHKGHNQFASFCSQASQKHKDPSPRRSAHPSMRKDRLPRASLSSRRSRSSRDSGCKGFCNPQLTPSCLSRIFLQAFMIAQPGFHGKR